MYVHPVEDGDADAYDGRLSQGQEMKENKEKIKEKLASIMFLIASFIILLLIPLIFLSSRFVGRDFHLNKKFGKPIMYNGKPLKSSWSK